MSLSCESELYSYGYADSHSDEYVCVYGVIPKYEGNRYFENQTKRNSITWVPSISYPHSSFFPLSFHPIYLRKHKEAFVPPNPKLLDSTTSTSLPPPPPHPRGCATSGTRLNPSGLSGFVKLRVGGRMFCRLFILY